jgi:hypothetical protein
MRAKYAERTAQSKKLIPVDIIGTNSHYRTTGGVCSSSPAILGRKANRTFIKLLPSLRIHDDHLTDRGNDHTTGLTARQAG